MADNTIDTLSLEIGSNSSKAEAAIGRLAESLGKLQASLSGISYSQFTNISSGISQLSTSMTHFSQSVKTADFTRIATGLNKLANVKVQGVSDASRAISTLTSNLSQMGAFSFDSQGIANIANAISQLGRKTVTQATDNIPKLSATLSGLATELKTFGSVSFDTTNLSNLVASITKLGGKAATNAIPNIKALGMALKEMMATLSTAPKVSQNLIQMTTAMAQLASNGGRVTSASSGLISGLNGVASSSGRAKKHIFSLAAAFGKFYATYWLLLRGLGQFKKAIDISSDLTEVQNVVDVTFGDMARKVEDLSKVSIQDFGMSELTAKQISSRFQAMGVAMGFTQERMSDMSIELTKLAADMASFYNVEQEAVAESLESIFTGQTRPLRTYGLDLTQATVQEWAMKQGIDANMKSMSQAEKTMLRYQYVIANTAAAQGDFARTQDTWANQVRILAQNFEQLGSVIGGTLINAFKPFVKALNSVMQSVIAFAKTVANALGAIFGWTIEINSGGLANDFEAAGAGAEEMNKGTGGAAKNLKEMNKYIAAWHEVNNMTTSDSGKGGGGGGGGGGGSNSLGDAAQASLVRTDSIFEKYKSEIDSLYELGEYIGDTLTNAMNRINWDSVYQSARNFGAGLAQFLNGLISPELFGATGRTIAGALNTALHFLDSFGTTFSWINFGNSIAAGVNNFFDTFNFELLASALNTWANGLLDALIEFLDKTNWDKIGGKIGEFLEDLDLLEVGKKVAKAIWKAINAGFDLYKGMFEKAPLETAILTLVGATKLLKTDKVKKFTNNISKGTEAVKLFGKALMGGNNEIKALQGSFPKLGKVVDVAKDSVWALKAGFTDGNWMTGANLAFGNLNTAVKTTIRNMSGLQKGILTAGAVFGEFSIIKDSFYDIAMGSDNLLLSIGKIAGAAGAAGYALSTVFGPAGIAIAAITGIVAAVMGINDAMKEIDAQKTGEDIKEAFYNPGGVPLDEIVGSFSESVGAVGEGFEELSEKSKNIDAANSKIKNTWLEIEKVETSMEAGVISVDEGTQKLSELFGELALAAEDKFSSLETTLLTAFGENGVLTQVYDRLGISTENTTETILQLHDKVEQRIQEITKTLSTLDPSNPQYATLKTELSGLMGTTNEVSEAISKFELEIGAVDIDYSGLILDDGSLDTTKLTGVLSTITTSMDGANRDVQSGVAGIKTSLESDLAMALQLGDMQTAEVIQAKLNALPEALTLLQGDIATMATEVTDKLQADFIGQIDTEIENAQVRWENMSVWERFASGFDTKDEYVQGAVKGFKENYIDPLTSEIETAYGTVGVEGAGFAREAAENMMNELFITTKTVTEDAMEETTVTLNSSFHTIVSDAVNAVPGQVDSDIKSVAEETADSLVSHTDSQKDKIKTAFEGYAAYSEEGFRRKVEELSKNSTPGVMNRWAMDGIQNPFTMVMGINSPSTIFSGYGKNTVEGFNSGIKQNQDSSQGIIGTWVSKIKGWFTNALDINSPSGVFEDFAKYTVAGFNKGISGEMSSSKALIGDWTKSLVNGFDFQLTPNLHIPKPDFSPKSYNLGSFQSTMQMELDARMAEMEFENRQLRESMKENNNILEKILAQGIILDDNEFNRRYKSGASKYRKQTGRQLGISY